MRSFLEVDGGLFDPTARFAFTNITQEDFVSAWDGVPITVKPGQTIELRPGQHSLAINMVTQLVDKIMIGEVKTDEMAHQETNPYYRSPKGSSLGVPMARKPYEDRILRKLEVDEESPELQLLRAQIKSEILHDLNKQPGISEEQMPRSIAEFADINNEASHPDTTQKPKRGRPSKANPTL